MTIRVTQLEKFRRWRDGVSPFDSEQGVIDTLSGAFTGNEYTWIGTAFHKIVEQGESAWDNGIVHTQGGYVYLNETQKDMAILYRETMPEAFHETRLSKQYPTNHGTVTVTGCADIIHGNVIRDIKTKYSAPVQQEYTDSCQWRFYLDIFDADRFAFDLFWFKNYNRDMGMDVSKLELKQLDPIPCLRYANMERDLRILLDDFMDWIDYRNLYELINDIKETPCSNHKQ